MKQADPNGAHPHWPEPQWGWGRQPPYHPAPYPPASNGNGRGWGDLTKGSIPVVLAITVAIGVGWAALQAGILWAQTMGRLEGIEMGQKRQAEQASRIEAALQRVMEKLGWTAEVKR